MRVDPSSTSGNLRARHDSRPAQRLQRGDVLAKEGEQAGRAGRRADGRPVGGTSSQTGERARGWPKGPIDLDKWTDKVIKAGNRRSSNQFEPAIF